MTNNWFRTVLNRLFLLVLLCLPVGLLLDQLAWTLVVGLALYIGWTLRQMLRLHHWLRTQPDGPPPEARGSWAEIFNNIHQMQRREARRNAKLQAIIERIQASTAALNDAVVMIDYEGHLEWWNHAAEKLLGLRAPADGGQHVTNLIRDPLFVEYFEKASFKEPLDIPSPIDMKICLQYTITRYGRGDRLMIARDVTRLHNLEQMRKDFVANVSHELRTPLTVVVGYLETMLDAEESLSPRWIRALRQMQQQATRMHSLLNDLLLLARLETTDSTSDDESIAVSQMLSRIRQDAITLSAERSHRITLTSETERYLRGIEGELHSAFSNLVFNAVKYTPDQGDIRIRWWEDQQGAHLSVSDNGAGIAPEHLNRLTERFYRVDSSRSTHTGGTGLGLAIVKHVLMRHQGRLEITSTPGKGSCFTCHFPTQRLTSEAYQAPGE
ncbi:MAG TPA: phosphate regulon sensor histidine kinase PhoR [Pseudomonas xinjiangensis]|uniref:Phosphate regulon sensor protein PhoR n=2 Tax=root TaxID=1 RepID=A0A7V1BT47_9GAMM|nr:phosphate regulon sensor histidine kinase PhoR [Halopseudomonas xinjiangensis]HEC47017.1 phosphate regulon sensor histidine kinase PhoR [Halopseudomonas xinjiangensis]